MDEYVDKIVELLLMGDDIRLKFVEEYLIAICNLKPDPKMIQVVEGKLKTPVIELYSLHLSKALNKCMKINNSVCTKMKDLLCETTLAHIRADFQNSAFQHNVRGAHYVAIAMHAVEQIISVKWFAMICILTVAIASTSQQQLAVYELVIHGWDVLPQKVVLLLVTHMCKQLPTMHGRAKNCYEEIVEHYDERYTHVAM